MTNWRRGFDAWQEPDPKRDGAGLTWRQLTPTTGPAPGIRRSAARLPATARLGRLPPARGPARPLTHHHRRRLPHHRGSTGRYRPGVGVPLTTETPTLLDNGGCPALAILPMSSRSREVTHADHQIWRRGPTANEPRLKRSVGRRRTDAEVSICCVVAPGRKSSRPTPGVRLFGGRPHGRSRRLGELGELAAPRVWPTRTKLTIVCSGGFVAIKQLASAFDRNGWLRRAVPPRARAAAHLN
jgi:hypothetical protein